MRRRHAAEGDSTPPPPEESLFTTQLPAGDGQDGGAPGVTTGLAFMVAVAGTIKGIRFYSALITGTDTYTVELWQATSNITGNRLGVKAALGSTLSAAPGWSTILFDAPVSVVPGVVYVATQNNNHNNGGETGRYVYALNFWSVALTVGNLTGLQDGVDPGVGFAVGNGKSKLNTAPNAFPDAGLAQTNYFIDVVFQASA